MKNSKLRKTLYVLLQFLGFPLMILVVFINMKYILKKGASYGIFVYAGLIMATAIGLVYFIIMIRMKKRKKKSPLKQGVILAIFSMCALTGLWLFIVTVAPKLLLKATQGTIYMEHLTDDFNARVDINDQLIDDFIKLNVYNKNLVYTDTKKDPITGDITLNGKKLPVIPKLKTNYDSEQERKAALLAKEQAEKEWEKIYQTQYEKYRKLGYKSKRLRYLMKNHFQSIHSDGNAVHKGPWVDFANSSRLTVPTLVHLLLDEKEYNNVPLITITADGVKTGPVKWTILDVQGPPLGKPFDPGMSLDLGGFIKPGSSLEGTLKAAKPLIPGIVGIIENLVKDKRVVGAPLYIDIDLDKMKLNLITSSQKRGMLGYQNSAWLDANNLIYMLLSVFSTRMIFLIFGGIIAVISIVSGLLLQGKLKIEEDEEKAIEEALKEREASIQ